jgi:signal transduction histidine kinase/tetratricopeptide (TPR) repeat protein
MKRDPGRHSTRLTVLFVAAILIPGSFLAYFSIQNIGSQKELEEKKLLEVEETLAEDLAGFLRNELLRNATEFFAAADRIYPNMHDVALPTEVSSYVTQAFAMDNTGRLLWPPYEKSVAATALAPAGTRFLSLFSLAQQAEFERKNYGEAARIYQEAVAAARNDARRAAATNGLARALAKGRQPEQAAGRYQILLERYGGLHDENGVYFARYALHQIARIGFSDPTVVRARINALLSRFINGKIPLSDQAGPLLRDIEKWVEQNHRADPENDPIPGRIRLLRSRLAFVIQDANHIDFFQSKDPGSMILPELGSFGVVAGQVEGRPKLFVTRRTIDIPQILGFQVNLEHLRSALLEQATRMPKAYRLNVAIVLRRDTRPAENELTAVRDLSPLVPWWRVSVSPEDPEIIARYALRRNWIYGTALALLAAGMMLGAVLVLRDVSRERRLSELRTDFVANVTHELKTPLTSIRMFAETLRMKRARSEAEQKECLDVIVGETRRLSRLINTVLDFSKIERGQKQYRMAEVNMSEVAESTLNTLKYAMEEQGYTLDAEIESEVRAVGDADALEQAMLNLIDNAVKYSRKRKSVQIGLWAEDNRVCFRVADKGIGIPESEKSRIFEKFYRTRTGNEQDAGGAGLGLTVVQHIVEAHGGTIEVESSVGKGSAFTITLPKIPQRLLKEEKGNDDYPDNRG